MLGFLSEKFCGRGFELLCFVQSTMEYSLTLAIINHWRELMADGLGELETSISSFVCGISFLKLCSLNLHDWVTNLTAYLKLEISMIL